MKHINEILTLDEIKARFRSNWVLLGELETDRSLRLRRGRVLWHSKDRREVYHKADELCLTYAAIVCTGNEIPEDTMTAF